MSRFGWISGLLYCALLVGMSAGFAIARQQAFTSFTSDAAQEAWQDWRDKASHADSDAPVRRVAPRSSEPPMLVLLRDHFAVSFSISVILTSALYWATAWFVRGALCGPAWEVEPREPKTHRR